MDLKLKGITWVGNIYQKFEAVCQEVDNIVSQDAIKYVENQVHSAGKNVKKLYSDVVLDLVSPVVSPRKHKIQSQPSRRNAEVSSLLKSTTAKNDIWKDGVDTVDRQSHEPDALDLPKHSQDLVAKGQYSGHHINEVEEPICENFEHDSIETKLYVRPSAGVASSINEVQSGQKENVDLSIEEEETLVSDDVAVKASTASSFTMERIDPENIVEKNYVVSIKQKTEDFPTEAANWVSPIKEMPSECLNLVQSLDDIDQNVSGYHVHGKGKSNSFGENHSISTLETALEEFAPLFLDGLSPRNGSFEGSVIDPSIVVFSENVSDDMVGTPAAASCQNKNFQSSLQETDEAEYDPSYLDTCTTLEMDRLCCECSLSSGGLDSDSTNSSMESIVLGDAPKLEESCVIVDDSQLHAVSSRLQKHRSYRKRIQDVFTSKKKLVKEYELLAVWYGDADIEPGRNNSRTLSAVNSSASCNRKISACDSEWELL